MESLVSAQMALRVVSKFRRTVRRDGKMIVISSMPKSGSTFLTKTIAAATGYQHNYLACAYGNIDQELYLPKLIDAFGRGTVTQQHFKANEHNLTVLQAYKIRPVVLVRNIFDALVSVRDHLEHENLNNIPGIHVGAQLLEFDLERQIDFVVDLIAPWFVGYYASWCRAETDGFPFLWMSYEDAIADWPQAVSRVLDYYEVRRPATEIAQAIETLRQAPREKTRLNQGVAGRGSRLLSPAQRDRVIRLTEYYRCDFTRIGIDRTEAAFAAAASPIGGTPATA